MLISHQNHSFNPMFMQPPTEKLKYFLYARKSTESEDRQVLSIDSQIQELQKIARQENIEILDIFQESRSAKAPGRPLFSQMLHRIQKREATGILCWKLDRLARNPIDGGQISWMLQQGLLQKIQTYGRSYVPGDNVLMMSVEFGMANQFIIDLSQNTKRGLRSKAQKGWMPGQAPLGYINSSSKHKGENILEKDSIRFPLIRKMFDLMLTGSFTPPKILEIANNEWGFRTSKGNPMVRSSIYRIFTNPFYYGLFEYPQGSGNWHNGSHKPMITAEEYDRIQILLGRKGNTRPQKLEFPYTGMIRCGECGAMITAERKTKRQQNGNIHHYVYYHCTKKKRIPCFQKCLEGKELEEQITGVLKTIEIPEDFYEWTISYLEEEMEKEKNLRNTVILQNQQRYNTCVRHLYTLLNMRIRGEVTPEEYLEKKGELEKEKLHAQKLLDDSDGRIGDWHERVRALYDFACYARKRFQEGDIKLKKEILTVFGSNLLLKDKKLRILLPKPFLVMQELANNVKTVKALARTSENGLDKRELWEVYANSPSILRDVDEVRTSMLEFDMSVFAKKSLCNAVLLTA